jgi:hypothetical protein
MARSGRQEGALEELNGAFDASEELGGEFDTLEELGIEPGPS